MIIIKKKKKMQQFQFNRNRDFVKNEMNIIMYLRTVLECLKSFFASKHLLNLNSATWVVNVSFFFLQYITLVFGKYLKNVKNEIIIKGLVFIVTFSFQTRYKIFFLISNKWLYNNITWLIYLNKNSIDELVRI